MLRPTAVWEMRDGAVERFHIDPADYGHAHESLEGLTVETALQSADLIKQALGRQVQGANGARRQDYRQGPVHHCA